MSIEYIDPATAETTIPKTVSVEEGLTDIDLLYFKELIETEGFGVEQFPDQDDDHFGVLVPIKDICKDTYDAAQFAVSKFNELKGTAFKFVNVVRGSYLPLFRFDIMYFLTLECSDGCFYEVKVMTDESHNHHLKIFRPAKYYKREDKKTDAESSIERKRETDAVESDEGKKLKISA